MIDTDEEVREVIENLKPIKDLEVEMKKRNWNDLTKEQKQELIRLADSLYIPPNFVQTMYENHQIELP